MKIVSLDTNTITSGDVDLSALEALGEVSFLDMPKPEEVVSLCEGAQVVLTNKTNITREIIEQLPELRYIGLYATGYNNVDIEAARAHGVDVTNVPGYSTDSVAQLVFAFILSHATSVAPYAASVQAGDWMNVSTFTYFAYPMTELAGKVLGIVGYGNLGKKVAQIGTAFGMEILIHSRRIYDDCPYRQVGKEELFRESDYLTLNCPLNEGTANIINEQSLQMMKPTAFLINTARGGCVDAKALRKALDEGRIAGAGIDVLTHEPMAKDEPLFGAKNCMMTPHIGWAALETRKRLIGEVAANIAAWQNGTPRNVVNP